MNIIYSPHLFGLKNNSLDSLFVPLSFASVKRSNPKSNIVFLDINKNIDIKYKSIDSVNCQKWSIPDLETLNKNYLHLSTNSKEFELFCISRFFYIREWMRKTSTKSTFIIETDVLLLRDLHEIVDADIFSSHAALSEKKCISFGWITEEYVENYCDYVNKIYSTPDLISSLQTSHAAYLEKGGKGGICDMSFCDYINRGAYGADKKYAANDVSKLIVEGNKNSFFDSFIGRDKLLGCPDLKFNMTNSKYDGKLIKDIEFANSECFANSNQGKIRMNSIHCQGNAKLLMSDYYLSWSENI